MQWVDGETVGEPEDGEDFEKWHEQSVQPSDLAPWLWTKLSDSGSWVRWRLDKKWWDGLAIFPLIGLTIWLWWCARKRPPIVPPAVNVGASEPPIRDMPPTDISGGGSGKPVEVAPIARSEEEPVSSLGSVVGRSISAFGSGSTIEAEPPSDAAGATEERAEEPIEPPSAPTSTHDEETDGVYRIGGSVADSADESADEDFSFDDIVGMSPVGDTESPEAESPDESPDTESPKTDNAADTGTDGDDTGDADADHGDSTDPEPDPTNR